MGLRTVSSGGSLASVRAPVTSKKAFSVGGDVTTSLWIFSFLIMPSPGAARGHQDGNCKSRNGQGSFEHEVGEAEASFTESPPRVFSNPCMASKLRDSS